LIQPQEIQKQIGIKSKDTLNQLIKKFERMGILKEISGKKRYRKYLFTDYITIIKKGTEIK